MHYQPGFMGLVADGGDLAVRMTLDANAEALQAQLRFAMREEAVAVRTAVPGMRWWRLGLLTDAELWRAKEMVAVVGLQPLNEEVRVSRMGPFRSCIYFAAVGQPRCPPMAPTASLAMGMAPVGPCSCSPVPGRHCPSSRPARASGPACRESARRPAWQR